MKSKKLIFTLGCILLVAFIVIVAMGQNNSNTTQSQKPELVDRFERVIKNKEPKFKNNKSRYGERIGKFVNSSMNWVLHTDNVSLTLSEFDTAEDAQKKYLSLLDIPLPEPSPATNITNLGEQAFSRISGGEKGGFRLNMYVRKGNILLAIQSNNFQAAKRFARHFVREIEKRDRGEP